VLPQRGLLDALQSIGRGGAAGTSGASHDSESAGAVARRFETCVPEDATTGTLPGRRVPVDSWTSSLCQSLFAAGTVDMLAQAWLKAAPRNTTSEVM
jgi:hypothetical protein